MNLTVVGLGKLGLPLAALHAQHHRVFGIDQNGETVKAVNASKSPIVEPGLPLLLRHMVEAGNLTAHTSYIPVEGTDLSMVIVPTPSTESGTFSSQYVLDAVTRIGRAVADQPNRHVVVICSTVMPGTCEGEIRTCLEVSSGKTVGDDIGLVYSPEFIALGTVIEDMKFPAMTLIGESDPTSGQTYLEVARSITNEAPSLPPHRRMSLTSAEIAKISLNAYVTMKISFANTIGELCESIPTANARQVTDAIGLDPRVGRSYIHPGGPYGGPCFPRDNRAFAALGRQLAVPTPIAIATDEVNDRQIDRTIEHIERIGRTSVGVLGLTYKPGAPIYEESFGMKLAIELTRREYLVKAWDPLATARPDLPIDVAWQLDPAVCFGNETTTIIANDDPKIAAIFPDVFSPEKNNFAIVIDCWDFLPTSPWDDSHILRLGRG